MRLIPLSSVLVFQGCLLGVVVDIPVPELDGVPVVVEPPPPDDGGLPAVRAGDRVVVDLRTAAPLDVADSRIALAGRTLACAEVAGERKTYRCEGTLDGTEVQGRTRLQLEGSGPTGRTTDESRELLIVDHTRPTAGCVLTPRSARATTVVTFDVIASEALRGGLPIVTDPAGRMTATHQASDGGQHTFAVQGPPGETIEDYTLVVTATDRAGNVQEGESLCAAEDRTGSWYGVAPSVADGPMLSVVAGPQEIRDGVVTVGLGARIELRLPVEGGLDPAASTVLLGELPFTSSGDGTTWTLTIQGDASDGRKEVRGALVDDAGNRTPVRLPDASLVVDLSAPSVSGVSLARVPAFAPASETPGTVRFSAADPFTGEVVLAALEVSATEPLAGMPSVQLTGPSAVAWPAPTFDGASARWSNAPLPDAPGVYAFDVVLEDTLGNVSEPLRLGVTMTVVAEAQPAPPDVDTLGRIVHTRIPWGAPETGGQPRFEVEGDSGSAPSGATIVVSNDADQVLGTGRADESGAWGPIRLLVDAPVLFVSTVDSAGLRSDPARVRDVVWTATLGGKIPGRLAPNPHRLTGDPIARPGLVLRDDLAGASDTVVAGASVVAEAAGTWIPASIQATPPYRERARMALDPVRDEVVLVGGRDASGDLSDVWAWDGAQWSERPLAGRRPPVRDEAAFVFDPSLQGLLFLGGQDAALRTLGDMWLWDGAGWTEVTPPTPVARRQPSVGYDPRRSVVVLQGGLTSFLDSDRVTSTHVWDGTAWTDVSDAGPVPPTLQLALVHDPVGGGVIGVDALGAVWRWDGVWSDVSPSTPRAGTLRAGPGGVPQLWTSSRVWAWDGADWRVDWSSIDASPDLSPTTARLAVAPDRMGFVVFGAEDWESPDPYPPMQTWRLVDGAWSDRTPDPDRPDAREAGRLAWDPAAERLLLFGGEVPRSPLAALQLDDTWSWDGRTWSPVSTFLKPTVLRGSSLVVEPSLDRLTLWDGDGDPWGWAGVAWAPEASPNLSVVGLMAYDPVRDEVIAIEGDATWSWDGDGWSLVAQAGEGPAARTGAAMAFDPVRSEVVLFGGRDGPMGISDWDDSTWVWDGAAWTEIVASADGPQSRLGHVMATDPARGEVVLFGGQDESSTASLGADTRIRLDDTWVWEGRSWRRIPTDQVPDRRLAPSFGPDEAAGRLVLYGGGGDRGTLDDTWLWKGGADHHPAQVLTIDWDAALVPEAELSSVTVQWTAGGVGFDGGDAEDGAVLSLWGLDRWEDVDVHSAGLDAPAALCVEVRADGGPAQTPDCATAPAGWDPNPLVRSTGVVQARVVSVAASGAGTVDVRQARVATGTVAVRVAYRVP